MIECALFRARAQDKELYVEGEHTCDLRIVSASMSTSLDRIKVYKDREYAYDLLIVSISISMSMSLYKTKVCEHGEHART